MTTTTSTNGWYTAADTPELVTFGTVAGLGVSGHGSPGGPTYVDSVRALYAVAGQLLALAAAAGNAMSMPLLEGQWWVEDDRPPFEVPREEWRWHLFLRLPDTVEPAWVDQAREQAVAAGASRAVARVRLVTFTEDTCVQVLHQGSYADEPRSLAAMERFMSDAGLVRHGLHHEIYLTDVQQTPPEHARTILRQPVRPTGAR